MKSHLRAIWKRRSSRGTPRSTQVPAAGHTYTPPEIENKRGTRKVIAGPRTLSSAITSRPSQYCLSVKFRTAAALRRQKSFMVLTVYRSQSRLYYLRLIVVIAYLVGIALSHNLWFGASRLYFSLCSSD